MNAVKYAFPGDTQGTVLVTLKRVAGELRLTVADNGRWIDPKRGDSGLGFRLVEGFTNSSAVNSNGRAALKARPCAYSCRRVACTRAAEAFARPWLEAKRARRWDALRRAGMSCFHQAELRDRSRAFRESEHTKDIGDHSRDANRRWRTVRTTNQAYQRPIGHRDVIGPTIREANHEAESHGFVDLLGKVFVTGKPFTCHSS